MKSKVLFILIFFNFSLSLSAQKKKSDIELIKFEDESDGNFDKGTSLLGYNIKTSPTSYLIGSQFVEVEKYVTDFLSVQAGLGVTFKPIIGEQYGSLLAALEDNRDVDCNSDIWTFDICDDYSDLTIRNFKLGFMFSTSIRLFFDDDAMDGSYFAVKLRYAKDNIRILDIAQNSTSLIRIEDRYVSESVKRFDLVGHYGYQTLYSRLSAEYFVGLGARFRNETRQDIGQNASGVYKSAPRSFKVSGLRIEGGIRIGFQL